MTQKRKFGNHFFRKVRDFNNETSADDYIENVRSYGEQV